MTNGPFLIRYVDVDRPTDLRVAVNYAPRDAGLQDAIASLDRVFGQLERFGSAGGFAGNMCPPARSNMRRLGVSAHGNLNEWSFEIVDVSPGLLFFVGNILHRHALEEAAVSQVTIASSLWNAQDAVAAPPPTYFKPLPFALEDCLESRRAVITVRFVDEVPGSIREVFESVWQAWVDLAEAGAFSDKSFDIGRSTLLATEPPLSLPDEIMFVHDRAMIARTGFDCLVNTFHALHATHALLEEVVIS